MNQEINRDIVYLTTVIGTVMKYYYDMENPDNSELFYPVDLFSDIKFLEDNWETIANEIPPIDYEKLEDYQLRSRTAWNNDEGQEALKNIKSDWMVSWQGKSWYNFPLMYHNNVIDISDQICPKTIEILKKVPSIQIAGYSLILPGGELTPHTDATGKMFGSLACNLMLTDNKNCYLYVKDFRYEHLIGKAVVFDSTYEHWADNQDNKPRVILYIDFKTNIFEKNV